LVLHGRQQLPSRSRKRKYAVLADQNKHAY
jgi:hypothetical protein